MCHLLLSALSPVGHPWTCPTPPPTSRAAQGHLQWPAAGTARPSGSRSQPGELALARGQAMAAPTLLQQQVQEACSGPGIASQGLLPQQNLAA
jgi:hypothetical protein